MDNIVTNGGKWVSEGFKCWMEHCVARRAAAQVKIACCINMIQTYVPLESLFKHVEVELSIVLQEELLGRCCYDIHECKCWLELCEIRRSQTRTCTHTHLHKTYATHKRCSVI